MQDPVITTLWYHDMTAVGGFEPAVSLPDIGVVKDRLG